MFIPQAIRVEFDRLRGDSDLLSHLRSLEVLSDWVADMKVFVAGKAKKEGYTLHQIGEVQHKPRQAVHRTLKSGQSRGLTDAAFDGVDSSTLRYWLDWWSDPARRRNGRGRKRSRPEGRGRPCEG